MPRGIPKKKEEIKLAVKEVIKPRYKVKYTCGICGTETVIETDKPIASYQMICIKDRGMLRLDIIS